MAETRPLFALTLWRPWCWAIVHGFKDVENREWAPPSSLRGQLLAIHSGKTWDADGAEWLRLELGLPVPDERAWFGGRIVGITRCTGVVTSNASPYFCGPFGWTLSDSAPFLRPVLCRGAQRLWRVEGEPLQQVRREYARAREVALARQILGEETPIPDR